MQGAPEVSGRVNRSPIDQHQIAGAQFINRRMIGGHRIGPVVARDQIPWHQPQQLGKGACPGTTDPLAVQHCHGAGRVLQRLGQAADRQNGGDIGKEIRFGRHIRCRPDRAREKP